MFVLSIKESIPWVFSGLGLFVIPWLWRKIRHCSFDPVVVLRGEEGNAISIPSPQQVDINALINKAVDDEDKSLPRYNVGSADPYLNPWNVVPEVSTKLKNQRHYMDLRDRYIDSFHAYQYDLIRSQLNEKKMYPINLILKNTGRKSGKNIEVELTIKGMLYTDNNRKEKTARKYKRPTDIGNSASIILSQIEAEDYFYNEWDLNSPLSSPQLYIEDYMNAKSTSDRLMPKLYYDASGKTNVVIHWKVFEESMEEPKEGDIFISTS